MSSSRNKDQRGRKLQVTRRGHNTHLIESQGRVTKADPNFSSFSHDYRDLLEPETVERIESLERGEWQCDPKYTHPEPEAKT